MCCLSGMVGSALRLAPGTRYVVLSGHAFPVSSLECEDYGDEVFLFPWSGVYTRLDVHVRPEILFDEHVSRINPMRLRRGKLLPGESLFVQE